MPRNATVALLLVLALCAGTYLVVEMPWRFTVVETGLFGTKGNGSDWGDWDQGPVGVSLVENSGRTLLCLEPPSGEDAAYVMRTITNLPQFGYLRISSAVEADALVPGEEGWQQGNLLAWSFGEGYRPLKYWPKTIASAEGTSEWARYHLVVPILDSVKALRLIAYNAGLSGEMCLQDLRIDGLEEKSEFTFLRYGLFAGWIALTIWIVLAALRARGSPGLKAAVFVVGVATYGLLVLPQPYYGQITEPIEAWAYSLAVGEAVIEAADQSQAERDGTEKGSSDSAASGDEPDVSDGTGQESPAQQDGGTASDGSGELVAMGEQDSPGAAEADDRRPLLLRIWHSLSPLAFEDLLHAASFLLLAFFSCLAFERTPLPLLALFLGLAVIASESLQLLLITRSSEWRDLLADAVGLAMGISAGALVRTGLGARRS